MKKSLRNFLMMTFLLLVGSRAWANDAQTYAVNIAEGIENGTVVAEPISATAGAEVTLTVTPEKGYELASVSVTGVNGNEAVIVSDGKFTMPADDVTVNATFTKKIIYIETDLTADFDALTVNTNWKAFDGSTARYTATGFCPAVTTNSGKTVQVCEFYKPSCEFEGDVLTQTIKNLTPGTYKIELYGAAAFTFGRGFGSMAFTGDLSIDLSSVYKAGDKIEPTAENSTGVSLQATTSEGTYGGELPIFYATNFPEGSAIVTLNGVEVGQNGVLTIGMSKTSLSTNWHVIQLKGVTAQVLASDLLASTVAKAKAVGESDAPAAIYSQIQEAIATYDRAYDTADEYKAAVKALDDLLDLVAGYSPLSKVLNEGEQYKANSPAESPAIATYDAAIAEVKAAYDAAVVADIPAAVAKVEAALPAIAKVQTAPNSDMTRVIVNPTINDSSTGWTCKKPKGGNGPLLNGNSFEYWAGNASPRSEGSFDYYQIIKGLPNGKYIVSAEMFNSTNDEEGAVFAPTSGVYASSGNDEKATLVDVDGAEFIRYTTEEVLVKDGTLRFGVKNTKTPMAARWFVADNFTLTLVETIDVYDVTVVPSEHGTVKVVPTKAIADETIVITATPASGYELASVMVRGVTSDEVITVDTDPLTGEMSFTMPKDAVTVTATFQEAYVKVSDFAIASSGIYDEDGCIKLTGTFTSEVAGSYSEMFFGDVNFDITVVPTAGGDPIEGLVLSLGANDISSGEVYAYVPNLVPNTNYTVYVDAVHVWDYVAYKEIFTVTAAEGEHLATTTFIAMPPTEMAVLNVERYVGYGYATTIAEVDFTSAKEFLGVDKITSDMLYIVNPDFSQIKDYAPYDGWFDGDGKAEKWGGNSKINVKFFEALSNGKYSICDMNGADVVDAIYTVRWALVANYKAYVYTINVKFAKEPAPAPEIAAVVDVPVLLKSGTAYEEAKAAFNVLDVTTPLNLGAISEAAQYIVNVTDGSFVPNSTDGWRDANGDAAAWGTAGEGMVCVKISDPASGIIDYLGAIDDSYEDGDTYTAKWGFVNTASNTAVILNINITFVADPTGIEATPAAEGVKADGKYFENGKIVIYKNGNKYDVSGAPLNK